MSTSKQQVIVVGGGPAGCAAALEAAARGLQVMLIDEHPQALAAMSLDAPYFYGTRLAPLLSDVSATAERVLGSNEALLDCLEAGVDVLTGTSVWGVFGPNRHMEQPTKRHLGLADETRSWMVAFDHLILATGARDLVLSFPGWHLPGVLGVKGASALLQSYQALGGGRILVLGSGNAALVFAKLALDNDLQVAGIVEPAAGVQGDAGVAEALHASGVPFFLNRTIEQALGDREVTGARLVSALGVEQTVAAETVICDTICMAYGVVPNIELASSFGCDIEYRAALGGWVPRLGARMESSQTGVFVVGDAAGVTEGMLLSSEAAAGQGRHAAIEIARREGLAGDADEFDPDSRTLGDRALYPPDAWLDALVAAGGLDVQLCQCEDVTRRELMAITPPRYLKVETSASKTSLSATRAAKALGRGGHEEGVLSQDFSKRMTRVGMGHCQGKRCREHSAMLLAHAAGVDLAKIWPGSYRVPVRPINLAIMAAEGEPAAMTEVWSGSSWLNTVDPRHSDY